MWRLALALGLMVVAVGCTTKWVHPDPTADWDAAYAECYLKIEAVGSGEMHEQAMKNCLEAKGWEVRKPRRPSQPFKPDRPGPKPKPRPS